MNYDSSNSRNTGCAGRASDTYEERSPSEAVSPALDKTRETARNWAWAHINESYDWMDSHSPFATQDVLH